MKIETKDNVIILKEVFNGITLETDDGKQLHICMRDGRFQMRLNNSDWYKIKDVYDFLPNSKVAIK